MTDVAKLCFVALMVGLLIAYLVSTGVAPTRGGMVRRSENPTTFWLSIFILGGVFFVFVALGLYLTLTHR